MHIAFYQNRRQKRDAESMNFFVESLKKENENLNLQIVTFTNSIKDMASVQEYTILYMSNIIYIITCIHL